MAAPAKKKKRRLGKGLESLLARPVEVSATQPKGMDSSEVSKPEQAPAAGSSTEVLEDSVEGMHYLSVDAITPNPRQPRQVFDDDGLMALADSIKTAGLMQPIVVRASAKKGSASSGLQRRESS